MEGRRQGGTPAAALMPGPSETRHLWQDTGNLSAQHPCWAQLEAAAAQAPTTRCCVFCGGEHVYPITTEAHDPGTGECFEDTGWHCQECGAVEEVVGERNDAAEALAIALASPAYDYRQVSRLQQRHVVALAQCCLALIAVGGRQ